MSFIVLEEVFFLLIPLEQFSKVREGLYRSINAIFKSTEVQKSMGGIHREVWQVYQWMGISISCSIFYRKWTVDCDVRLLAFILMQFRKLIVCGVELNIFLHSLKPTISINALLKLSFDTLDRVLRLPPPPPSSSLMINGVLFIAII